MLWLKGGNIMSHAFQISDELYEKLAAYAAQQKQTPEKLFLEWVSEIAQRWEEVQTSNHREHEHKVQVNQDEREGYDEEILKSPLLQIAGMFAIGEPGWADRHDEYLAEVYADDHANEN
jgi:hypothetical protein